MSLSTNAPTPGYIVANRGNPAINAQHILHGYLQFNAGNYEDAMLTFQLTEAEPLQILSLFPDVLPAGLGQPTAPGLSSPFSSLPPITAQNHPVPVQKVQGEDRLFRALSALIPYLAQIQNRLRLTLEEKGFGRKEQDDIGSTNGRRNKQPSSSKGIASGPDSNLALAILVDTVLLKAYLLCDIPLLPFLSSPYNLCDIDECANILRAYEKYHELIAFYKFRARHGQALELLSNLGQMSVPKSNTSKSTGPAHTSQSLQPSTGGASSALHGLNGTEASVKYMQELAVNIMQPCYPYPGINLVSGGGIGGAGVSNNSHTYNNAAAVEYSPTMILEPNPDMIISLILHFSKWILQADVDDGLRIFTFCHTMNSRPVEITSSTSSNKHGKSAGGAIQPQGSASLVHSYAHHKTHCIPSALVLEHLKTSADREACIAFLESLINHLGEQDALFHNELVFMYLQSIEKLLKAKEQREATLRNMQAANGTSTTNATPASVEPERIDSVSDIPVRAARQGSLVGAGSSSRARGGSQVDILTPIASTTTSGATVTSGVSTRDASRLSILRRKLLEFLRSSTSYTAEKMLSRFPRHALLEERAILLSRINQHVQALSIYAHDLNDPLQAEAYAEEYYLQAVRAQLSQDGEFGGLNGAENASAAVAAAVSVTSNNLTGSSHAWIVQGKDMYLNLLQVYLKPPQRHSQSGPSVDSGVLPVASSSATVAPVEQYSGPMLDEALTLLTKYHDRISPVAAIEALPLDTRLQVLWPYFERLLCQTTHTLRDEQITKQLLKSEYYAIKEEHLRASRGRVGIDQNSNCGKCNKKLGNSAFARYPNGQIVHYVCHQMSLQGKATNAGDL